MRATDLLTISALTPNHLLQQPQPLSNTRPNKSKQVKQHNIPEENSGSKERQPKIFFMVENFFGGAYIDHLDKQILKYE